MVIRLDVRLTPSDEVIQLRDSLNQSQHLVDSLQVRLDRLEYLYRCETIINQELQDLLKEHRIPFRDAIKRFTSEGGHTAGGGSGSPGGSEPSK